MPEEPYKNRELTAMFEDIKEQLERIESQTIKTNGRVRSLEVYRGVLIGGLAVVTGLVIPLLFATFFSK